MKSGVAFATFLLILGLASFGSALDRSEYYCTYDGKQRDHELGDQTFNVAPYKVDCVIGWPDVKGKCLLINGIHFREEIDGFEFEEGFEYVLGVSVTKKPNADRLADARTWSYKLSKIISKETCDAAGSPTRSSAEDARNNRAEKLDRAKVRLADTKDRLTDARSKAKERIKQARLKAKALKERIGDENLIKDIRKDKIIYRNADRIDTLKRLCSARGGTFNECGSYCEEDETCAAVCVPTCEGITKRPAEVEERIKKELRIKQAENKNRLEFRSKVGDKMRAVRVDVQENDDGSKRRLIRFKSDDGDNKVVRTRLDLKDADGSTDTFVRVVRSDGVEKEIKVTPERVRAAALKRLNAADAAIELREAREGGEARVIYDVETNKRARFLGIFRTKMKMNAEVDPETGEILRVKKPWWAFLAGGEDNFDEEAEAQETDVACTEEARTCSDGSSVARNPDLDCEFDLCPGEEVSDEAACEEKEGIWGLHYLTDEAPSCNEPTSDAGASCTDSSECESFCEAPEGVAADATVTGTCHGYMLASCTQEVISGVAQEAYCA